MTWRIVLRRNVCHVWTKVYRVITKVLRKHGIRCLFFVDDTLCALPSKAEALRTRSLIEEMFLRSGLQRAPDKGVPGGIYLCIDIRYEEVCVCVRARACVYVYAYVCLTSEIGRYICMCLRPCTHVGHNGA